MRKLLTFTPEQWDYFEAAQKESRQGSVTAFIIQMLNERSKKSPGRPKANREDNTNGPDDEDTIEMYQNPDKFTTSPYSYNDLVVWYEAHPEEGDMPDRADLTIHKDYKKNRA